MIDWLTLDDIEVKDKRVLLRCDLDVPLNSHGQIGDNTRLQDATHTIKELLEKGAKLIICGHAGRPRGKVVAGLSLRPIAEELSSLLKQEIKLIPDAIGRPAESAVENLASGQAILLENLRYHEGEEANSDEFAEHLASIADVYINDAFCTAHRAHASTAGVTKFVETCAVGRHMQKEVETFASLIRKPERPFLLITGGAKVSSKIGVIKRLMHLCDQMIIGGAMANTFLMARGIDVGKSMYEPDYVDVASDILSEAGLVGCRLLLPTDFIVADALTEGAETQVSDPHNIPEDKMALDIGPQTVRAWCDIVIPQAKTILWNGPLGAFETAPFNKGTNEIAQAISNAKGFSIAGGGDTVAALNAADAVEGFNYLSTAGGALLEFLEGKDMPAIEALQTSKSRSAA